jgi:hypothetical protein
MKIPLLILLLAVPVFAGAQMASAPDTRPDLADEMLLQLSSRTNGASPDFTGPTDGSNWFQRHPFLAPHFWLRGVTNILAMSQGRYQGSGFLSCANYITPISPRICIGAAHTGGGVGTENLWLLPDGTYYTNTIIACLRPANGGDIVLMFMARTNWTFVKIFPDATNQLAFWGHPEVTSTVPVFVRFHQGIGRTNEFHSTFVSGSVGLGVFWHIKRQFEYGDYSKGDNWVAGDSSGAAYAIIANEAVLVGCASSGGYAMPIAKYRDTVNAAMAALCASNNIPAETLTLYNLGGFRDY